MPRSAVGNGINTTLEVVGLHNYFLSTYLLQMDRNFAEQLNDITIQLWLACDLIFEQPSMPRSMPSCQNYVPLTFTREPTWGQFYRKGGNDGKTNPSPGVPS